MARRKSNAEVGVFGVWAYDTRDALALSVEQVTGDKGGRTGLLPNTYSPATLRKIEGGSTKRPGRRMWRELRDLYARLAAERGIDIEPQPPLDPEPQPVVAGDTALIVAAIDRLTAAVEAQTASQVDSTRGLGDVLGEVLARLAGARSRTPGEQPDPV
jgi:hypothetical protein